MRPRVFLDTNLFIYAFEFPRSNSKNIVDLLNQNKFEAIISECVIKEVTTYFQKYYSKDLAAGFRNYLLLSCTVIPASYVREEMNQYRGKIKEKDLEQLAVVKKLGLKYLVSYDRDFASFQEYKTPKKFIETLNLSVFEEEY